MNPPDRGVWPALVTPLDEAGEPNLEALERLVELFVEQKLGGLYIIGSTGQWPLLAVEQRKLAAARVVQTAAGRIPIIVHVGALATDDAVSLARHAAQIGAQGVSAVAPTYYPAGTDATFEHYRRIGAAGDLPLYVYHLSLVHQGAIAARDYVRRLLELPHIAGMKITDRDLFQFGLIHSCAGDRLELFSGADEVMCQAALSGAAGAIGTFYNVWGPACQRARRAFVGGSFETGRKFMLAFQRAIDEACSSHGTWSFLRAAMLRKYAIDIGRPKLPLGMLDKPWPAAEVDSLLALVDEC
jgi:N-acetylneuraminate lyase